MRTVAATLAATLGVQTLASFAIQSAAVFGPVVTLALGVAPERVGIFSVVSYGFAMVFGMVAPAFITRFGPLRTMQLLVLCTTLGLLIAATGTIASVLAAAALTGIANGAAGPVCAHVLAERTPPGMMNLVFSIKQTGVPLGAALAGALVPIAVLSFDWRLALVAMAAVYVFAILAFQPLRADYDRHRDRSASFGVGAAVAQIRAALRMTVRDPELRLLAVIAFVYVGMQMIVVTFLVTYLHFELGYALVTAGLAHATMQFCGIAGRIVWGALGDRMRYARVLLGALGVGAGVAAMVLAVMTRATPPWAVFGIVIAFGFTGVAWNGIHFAEVARRVERADVGRATAGTMFFSFMGGITGPLMLSAVMPFLGAGGPPFALGFVIIGVASIAAGCAIALRPRPAHPLAPAKLHAR